MGPYRNIPEDGKSWSVGSDGAGPKVTTPEEQTCLAAVGRLGYSTTPHASEVSGRAVKEFILLTAPKRGARKSDERSEGETGKAGDFLQIFKCLTVEDRLVEPEPEPESTAPKIPQAPNLTDKKRKRDSSSSRFQPPPNAPTGPRNPGRPQRKALTKSQPHPGAPTGPRNPGRRSRRGRRAPRTNTSRVTKSAKSAEIPASTQANFAAVQGVIPASVMAQGVFYAHLRADVEFAESLGMKVDLSNHPGMTSTPHDEERFRKHRRK